MARYGSRSGVATSAVSQPPLVASEKVFDDAIPGDPWLTTVSQADRVGDVQLLRRKCMLRVCFTMVREQVNSETTMGAWLRRRGRGSRT
jgi:hypothetical protein